MFINVKYLFVILICCIKIIAGGHRDWWKYTTIYQVFVSSFKDSNGDGLGDIKGVTSMLDHFVDLGIETIWLSPVYVSPMVDNGYDVSDYYKINPKFGTMEDFDELVTEMKERKLKLVMDFVLNHSSDEHPWFLKSVQKIEPYTDYYVWKDAKGYNEKGKPIPPNNWITFLNTSSWTWNSQRKQFYYHFLNEHEVDLNLRNPNVVKEILNIIKFWFDKGVTGGRLDAPMFYIEDDLLRDEDYSAGNSANVILDMPKGYREYTQNLWESYEFIHELRKFVDFHYNSQNNDEKVLLAEAYTSWNYTMLYYGTETYKIAHFPFNFLFVFPAYYENPQVLDDSIKKWLAKMPANGVANWQAENHDMQRISDQINTKFSDIMLIIIMTLPGVACIYYGQEIGMVNTYPRSDQVQDFLGRDYARSPMQWDDSMNAGFSSNLKPWLPVNPNYWQLNVEAQKKKPRTRYNLYKTLSRLRQTPTLKHGNFTSYMVSSWVYAFIRSTSSSKDCSIIVVTNMGSETEVVNLSTSIPYLPAYLKILATSMNAGYVPGSKIRTNPKFPDYLVMRPSSAVVLST